MSINFRGLQTEIFFASINFRELPFQEFSKTFTFAKRTKIRKNRTKVSARESLYAQSTLENVTFLYLKLAFPEKVHNRSVEDINGKFQGDRVKVTGKKK